MQRKQKAFVVVTCLVIVGVVWLQPFQGMSRIHFSEVICERPLRLLGIAPPVDSQDARQRRLQTFCPSSPRGRSFLIFTDTPHHLAYCHAPKIGCTFWVNVFRFWANNTGAANVTSPFDISRVHTHYGSFEGMKSSHQSQADNTSSQDGQLRFMFTRDPYRRLWSAYIDKFLLPDFWVVTEAQEMIRRRYPNASKESIPDQTLQCPHNITFREFIKLLVTSDPKSYNKHWLPVHLLCDPCLFHPHFLGKMETFDRDAHTVLDHANETWIMDALKGRDKIAHEIAMLIDYNFWVLNRVRKDCLNTSGVSAILWRVFQLNGYLPDIPMPKRVMEREITAGEFKQVVLQAYEASKTTPADVRERRQAAFRWAYSTVDMADRRKLALIYLHDFILFDYDPLPEDVFGTSETATSSS